MNLSLSESVFWVHFDADLHRLSPSFALWVTRMGLLLSNSDAAYVCATRKQLHRVCCWWSEEISPKWGLDTLDVGHGGNSFWWHWFGCFSFVYYSLWNPYEKKRQNLYKTKGIRIYFNIKGGGWENKIMYPHVLLTCLVRFGLKFVLFQHKLMVYFSTAWVYL